MRINSSPLFVLGAVISAGVGAAATLVVTPATLPIGTIGASYSTTLAATGGVPPYSSWTVVSGSLPHGLNLDPATGAITGSPEFDYTGTYTSNFSVTVEDSAENISPEQTFSINVAEPVTISTLSLPGDVVGTAYSETLVATGGVSSTYTWAVVSGSLPPGLTLNTATGAITGTPSTATGSPFNFGVTASDTAGRVSAAQSFSIVIAASTAPATITLGSSANPAIYGQVLTLTATVSPSGATGKVTFYDDVSVLETIPVSGGQAVLKTIVLGTGSHSLRAYFNGLPAYSPATSTTLPQTVNTVAGTGFRAPLTYTVVGPPDGGPYSLAIADFNLDGKADFATTGGVALGNGDGTFQPFIATGPVYAAVAAVGDFNGDGKPDLATATSGILLGNGDGTFQSPIAYPSDSGTVIGAADFDGDGNADLATTTGILLSNGDGTFQTVTDYPTTGSALIGLAVGDFNGDGNADVFGLQAKNGGLSGNYYYGVLSAGNGDGTFQPVATGISFGSTSLPSPTVLAVADFNGDGVSDVALNVGGDLEIYLGASTGILQSGGRYILPNSGSYVVTGAVGDFNGDSKLDIALTDPLNNAVDVYTGNGDGTFQNPVVWSAGAAPQAVAVGNFNGDGRADILSSPSFNPASVDNTFTLLVAAESGLTPQTITFGPLSNQTLGSTPPPLSATANSGLAVTFASYSTSVCTVSGVTITLVSAGTCEIAASQSGNATYAPAPTVTQTFTVSAFGSQTITFGPLSNQVLGFAPPPLSATASSGLTVTFSSNSTTVCMVSGVNISLLMAGTCSITASQPGNGTYAAATPVTQTFLVVAVEPAAGFLDQYGAPALTFNGSMAFPDAGGLLIGPPGVAQAPDGDVYVVGLDNAGGVHLNSYSFANSTWNGWQYSGGILNTNSGMTAAVAPNGVVWFTGRDIGNRYWINSWNGTNFGGWILVADGIFASDSTPQIAIPSDGSIYVIGKDIGGRIWSNSYDPTSQMFTGWVDRQAVMIGQPSATGGQDGTVYVAVRSVSSNSPVYITQIPAQNAATANTWLNGGGLIDSDPQITSQGGTVYLTALAGSGSVYLLTFAESGQTFGAWTFTNETLSDETIASATGSVFIAGRDSGNRIYWYRVTGNSWFLAGGEGISSTVLTGAKQ